MDTQQSNKNRTTKDLAKDLLVLFSPFIVMLLIYLLFFS